MVERDKEIVKHVEKYGIITPKQCEKIFYKRVTNGYARAYEKLSQLKEKGYLNSYDCKYTKEHVFYIDKQINYHGILLMNYYAELSGLGVNIIHFSKEVTWYNGEENIRSDGFCVYVINTSMYFNIIEIQRSCNPPKLERYDKLYETGKLQEAYYGAFPRIIFISHRGVHKEFEHIKVVRLNLKLDNFASIFM